MPSPRLVITLLIALACILSLVGFAVSFGTEWRKSRNVTAAPPFRRLTESDRVIARLVNAVNYDMRSLELARWFIEQLIAAGGGTFACGAGEQIDLAAIAAKVPGANDVTKAELGRHLEELTDLACKQGAATGQQFATMLREFGESAYHPVHGILVGMPGYSVDSPQPLPR